MAAQDHSEAQLEQLGAASPAAERVTLQTLLKKHLNAAQWSQLEYLAQNGEIGAVALTRELLRATTRATLLEQIGQLKRRLNLVLPVEQTERERLAWVNEWDCHGDVPSRLCCVAGAHQHL